MIIHFGVTVEFDEDSPPTWLDVERTSPNERAKLSDAIARELEWWVSKRGLDGTVKVLEREP